MRLIDADALIERTEDTYCKDCDSYNGVRCRACPTDDMICDIENAPTVEKEQMLSSNGIAPCPFCGKDVVIKKSIVQDLYMVDHKGMFWSCNILPIRIVAVSEEKALEAWNRRV